MSCLGLAWSWRRFLALQLVSNVVEDLLGVDLVDGNLFDFEGF